MPTRAAFFPAARAPVASRFIPVWTLPSSVDLCFLQILGSAPLPGVAFPAATPGRGSGREPQRPRPAPLVLAPAIGFSLFGAAGLRSARAPGCAPLA